MCTPRKGPQHKVPCVLRSPALVFTERSRYDAHHPLPSFIFFLPSSLFLLPSPDKHQVPCAAHPPPLSPFSFFPLLDPSSLFSSSLSQHTITPFSLHSPLSLSLSLSSFMTSYYRQKHDALKYAYTRAYCSSCVSATQRQTRMRSALAAHRVAVYAVACVLANLRTQAKRAIRAQVVRMGTQRPSHTGTALRSTQARALYVWK